MMLDKYIPRMAGLPIFLLRLATEVDWESETGCFHSVASELGCATYDTQLALSQRSEFYQDFQIDAGKPVAPAEREDLEASQMLPQPPESLAAKWTVRRDPRRARITHAD